VTRDRSRVAAALLVAALCVAAAAAGWWALRRDTGDPCAGVTFHPPGARRDPGGPLPPPVGREPQLDRRIRAALRLPRSPVVYCADFADPFVVDDGGRVHAFATNTARQHVPVLSGAGLLRASRLGEALPQLPAWSTPGNVWAPAVLAAAPDRFVLFYTTRVAATGQQCIARVEAAGAPGPYLDRSTAPFLCPPAPDNAIDPSVVRTPDGWVLVWATYGPRTRHQIVAAPLAPDLAALSARPATLVVADQPWEGGVVEGPSMIEAAGTYHLVYSGNRWDTAAYAMGTARCAGPLGPCTKAPGPWIAGSGRVQGPGGGEVFRDAEGRTWLVFHAWVGPVGYPQGARRLLIAEADLSGPQPVLVVP
jgi:hypothetical protein